MATVDTFEVDSDDLSTWPDESLLLEYQLQRSERCFFELYRRYEHALLGHLQRYIGKKPNVVGKRQLAEDVLQETWLRVSVACEQFQGGKQLSPWLYAIATHKAIDLMRKEMRHCVTVRLNESRGCASEQEGGSSCLSDLLKSREPTASEAYETKESQVPLQPLLEHLPNCYRQVVDLIYFQRLKYGEVAKLLGLPVGTVKSRLHEAKVQLQKIAVLSGNSDFTKPPPAAPPPCLRNP